MYPTSPEFAAALRAGPTISTKVELLRRGEVVAELPLLSGTITDDAGAAVRRRCQIQLAVDDEGILPGRTYAEDEGLWPIGNQVRISQTMEYEDPDLTPETVPMGTFRISKPTVDDNGDALVLNIDGYDLSRAIARARFRDRYVMSRNQIWSTAIEEMITYQYPVLTHEDFDFTPTDGSDDFPLMYTPSAVLDRGDDPWDRATEMVRSFGGDLYVSRENKVTLRPLPQPIFDDPQFEYASGEGTILKTVKRVLDEDQAYNGVIVTAQSSSIPAPFRGEAWDTDPESATWFDPAQPWASEYGPVPYFITSEFITSQAQADTAAIRNLPKVCGIIEAISFDAVANWAHDSGDVIRIERDRAHVDGTFILESINMTLGETCQLSGTTRGRRAVDGQASS